MHHLLTETAFLSENACLVPQLYSYFSLCH